MKKELTFLVFMIFISTPAFSNAVIVPKLADKPVADIVQAIGIDQKLDQQIPLELMFKDETGRDVKLQDYFGSKPVILNLVYFKCPMLCGFVLDGLVKALKPLKFIPGREFQIVTVSIDPKDTPEQALEKKQKTLKSYSRPGAEFGWHFLTGSQESIDALAQAVGFRYVYDPKSGQYAHAGGIMVATPQGKLARYFYGIEYAPRDIRFALIEAAQNKIGSFADQLLLLCFHYDPMTGKYGFVIMGFIKLAGFATAALLFGGVILMLRQEKAGVK